MNVAIYYCMSVFVTTCLALTRHNTRNVDTVNLARFSMVANIRETLEGLKPELDRLDKIYKVSNPSRDYRALLAIITTNSWFTEKPIYTNDLQFDEALQAVRCLYEHIMENSQCQHHLNGIHCLLNKFWQMSKYNRCSQARNDLLVKLLNVIRPHHEDRTYVTEISFFIDVMATYRQNIFNYIERIDEADDGEKRRKKRRARRSEKAAKN